MGQLIPGHKYLLDIAPWGIQIVRYLGPSRWSPGDALPGAELDYADTRSSSAPSGCGLRWHW